MRPVRVLLLTGCAAIALGWLALAGPADGWISAPVSDRLPEASTSHESMPAVRPGVEDRSVTTAGLDRLRGQRLTLVVFALMLGLLVLASRYLRGRSAARPAGNVWWCARGGRGPPASFFAA